MESNCDTSVCPLLFDVTNYSPDSINLTTDQVARYYWIDTFAEIAARFVAKADSLHPDDISAKHRAEQCRQRYLDKLNQLRDNPTLLGPTPLSIRILLDLNERYLRENGFKDAWCRQKAYETKIALDKLSERLNVIDKIENNNERWILLCQGLLAGNMFDWGAHAIAEILENSNFHFDQALLKIESRPWLIDHLDNWLLRIQGTKHKCASIFVDNAGIDFVLGILPTARELLRQGTHVYLCANTLPSLNDVTYPELVATVNEAAKYCSVIQQSLSNGQLKCFQTGQTGPCLNLLKLHNDLCEAMQNCDLVILEGMGRALHTNLYAKLTVDCLKLAVVKNEWLANRLGGKKFSVICQYEPAPCNQS